MSSAVKQSILLALCVAMIVVTALTGGRLLEALLLLGFGLIVAVSLICRGKRWYAVRYIMVCYGFALLGTMAWKDRREIIALLFAAASFIWVVKSLMKLAAEKDEAMP